MAETEPTTTHESRKLTAAEVEALADRMQARAISVLFDVSPEVREDILVSTGCLRVLALIIDVACNSVTVEIRRP
jgi:hypothetical protein